MITHEHGAPLADPVHARQNELEAENAALRHRQVLLESAMAHHAALLDLVPAGDCTVCAQGMILQANPAACALLGVAHPALLNVPIMQFIVEADQGLFVLHCRRVADSGEPHWCELRMLSARRGQFWAQLQLSPAQDANGALQLRMLLSDANRREHGAATSTSTSASAAASAAGAGQGGNTADTGNSAATADEAESRLRSEISHELRQPLSALAIYASVLKSHVAPAGQPMLAQIKICLTTLSELLAK